MINTSGDTATPWRSTKDNLAAGRHGVAISASLVLLFVVTSFASEPSAPHWSYEGENGPEYWADLSPAYSDADGKNQSPINLVPDRMIEAELPHISLSYDASPLVILNNGHTIQVNVTGDGFIHIDRVIFDLKQFHFHSPSENQIDGHTFPMEVHLVHSDENGNLAVIGVMIEVGEPSDVIATLWAHMPEKEGITNHVTNVLIHAESLLPKDRDYYRYNGSLTTPPCTEGVRWLVMKNAIHASSEQIDQFLQTLHHPNNRPVQPINARTVLK